ncbi:Gfo/Idh/MocA family oxidoreductase [Planctomycetota bacterium]
MRLLIVGCGGIGCRHLQALAEMDESVEVQVVEPKSSSQETGKRLLEEVDTRSNVAAHWLDDIGSVKEGSDLAIVATTSQGRAEIIENLLAMGHKRFLIEKMVCQSAGEYDSLLDRFEEHQAKGWVNCTRRYSPFYKEVISLLAGKAPVAFNVTAGNLGLGCNAIHYLDLFAAIVTNANGIELCGDYLSSQLLPNERGEAFVELAGTLLARCDEDGFASITFQSCGDKAAGVISMVTEDCRVFVDEDQREAQVATSDGNWQWKRCNFDIPYTSSATAEIAGSIVRDDKCRLPTVQDSCWIHKELFRVFNQHIERVTGEKRSLCPVT